MIYTSVLPWPLLLLLMNSHNLHTDSPQLGAADAEIKVPSGENTELKGSPFKT